MALLNGVAVFLDFDGTVTLEDTSEHLLRRLAPPGWDEPGLLYRAGRITSRECLRREWAMLPRDEALLLRTAGEVPLDPGAGRLVAELRAAGAELTVVSDGFGFHAEAPCAELGVPLVSARVRGGELDFPHRDDGCRCASCGTCKVAQVAEARERGLVTVVIGDGTSDRNAARAADQVFAKEALADWCEQEGIAHNRFERLDQVRAALMAG